MSRLILPAGMSRRVWQLCMIGVVSSPEIDLHQVKMSAIRNLICLTGIESQEYLDRTLDSQGRPVEPYGPEFREIVLFNSSLPKVIMLSELAGLAKWTLAAMTVKLAWIEQYLVSIEGQEAHPSKIAIAKSILRLKQVGKSKCTLLRSMVVEEINVAGGSLAERVMDIQQEFSKFS